MSNAILFQPRDPVAIFAPNGSAAPSAPTDLLNDMIGVRWATADPSVNFLDIDLGGAFGVDTIALLGATVPASPQWILQAAATQAGLATPVYASGTIPFPAGSVAPVSGLRHSLHLTGAAVSQRWWRIQVGANFAAGRLVMGQRLPLARNFSFGAAFGVRDLGGIEFSPRGVLYRKPGVVQRTIGLRFAYTTRDEAETHVTALLESIGNSRLIMLVIDPDVDAQRERRMYFGALQGATEAIWNVGGVFEWRVNMISVI